VNLDVSLYHGGLHADLNETYLIGNVDEVGRSLVNCARECLKQAILTGNEPPPFPPHPKNAPDLTRGSQARRPLPRYRHCHLPRRSSKFPIVRREQNVLWPRSWETVPREPLNTALWPEQSPGHHETRPLFYDRADD